MTQVPPAIPAHLLLGLPMQNAVHQTREFIIKGVTVHGKTFRPSDWAERLCGVMSCYRPGGVQSKRRDAHIAYSPYVRPMMIEGQKCVVVDVRLRDIEPMALDFVLNFAKDNDLSVVERG